MVSRPAAPTGQVIGVNADAVSAHEPGRKGRKVPFGARGWPALVGVDPESVKQNRHSLTGDIDIALGVLR